MEERSYRWTIPYTTRRNQRFPTVRVTFTYSRTTRAVDSLVDSGAERSACSAQIAREAGIDPSQFPVHSIRGPGGIIRARLCPVDINMLGSRIATEILVLETNIVL